MLEAGNTEGSSRSSTSFEEALEDFYGNWICRAIHAMADHQDFKMDFRWISERLGVSSEEVGEAIEILTQLGLVRMNGNRFERGELSLIEPTPDEKYIGRVIRQHKLISEQTLNKLTEEKFGAYLTLVVPADREQLRELYYKVRQAFEEFEKSAKPTESSTVFSVNFTAVDLLDKEIQS
ncbi:MAG: DUF4423 domain-containing protein [Bdellovibrionales bacterium]|nr:DUF4423 domain-containing protein [Bdellovibrionales bacterium]